MPKLKDETYLARRAHILAAARRCFARNGFDGTSMQDLQREAGVSAGAIYVYFPRKSDLVEAVIDDTITWFAAICAETAEAPLPLRDALTALLMRVDDDATGPACGFGFHVWAESVRDERVARRLRQAGRRTCADLARMVERAVDAGELPTETDAAAAARTIYRAAYGYYAQRIVVGGVNPEAVAESVLSALGAERTPTRAA